MATCTVSVQLREPFDKDDVYDRLHSQMELHEFRRYVVQAGKVSKLPRADYRYRGDWSREEVLDKARTFIVQSVGGATKVSEHLKATGKPPYAVIVTEGEILHFGLESM